MLKIDDALTGLVASKGTIYCRLPSAVYRLPFYHLNRRLLPIRTQS